MNKMRSQIFCQLTEIFRCSIKAVLPENLISRSVKYNPVTQNLIINNDNFDLKDKNVFLVGFGKAVQNMAKEVENILGPKIKQGIISIPTKSFKPGAENKNVVYIEGAENNLPDKKSESAAIQIKKLVCNLCCDDLLIVLISGGGSALLPLPKGGIALDEKTEFIKMLANKGADITELNVVRKRISGLKGGKLAMLAQPAQVVGLILSDIVQDPLDLIASAPTVQDTDEPDTAINIIKKYNLTDSLPHSIQEVLKESSKETVVLNDSVKNHLIGSNKLSIAAAVDEAQKYNMYPIPLSNCVTGNVNEVAQEYVKLTKIIHDASKGKLETKKFKHHMSSLNIPGLQLIDEMNIEELKGKDILLVLGGETTVEVKGTGKGGRNQQIALEYSKIIHEIKADFEGSEILFLSAGTDGIDGPTDAAGAIAHLNLFSEAQSKGIDILEYLDNNDAYNFYKTFDNGELHIITGHTNTNVMDIHLILIKNKLCSIY